MSQSKEKRLRNRKQPEVNTFPPIYFKVYHAKNIKFDVRKYQFELNKWHTNILTNEVAVCSQVTIFGPFWNASLSKSNWKKILHCNNSKSLFQNKEAKPQIENDLKSVELFPPLYFYAYHAKTIQLGRPTRDLEMPLWAFFAIKLQNKQFSSLCFRTKKPKYKL